MIHSYFPSNRRTILPKFRLWRDVELDAAIESEAAMCASTTLGREVRFRLVGYSVKDQIAEVAELSPAGTWPDDDAPVWKVSFDAILVSEGGWPGFLSINQNRVVRLPQSNR